MSLIEWDESYSVNSEEMDEQHKKWIKMLNDLDDYMLNPPENLHKNLSHKILKEMMTYANTHFEAETLYMRSMDYPGLVEHVRRHKDFDFQIYEKYRGVLDGEILLNSELIHMIKDWLLNHILVEDKKYAEYAEGENNKLEPVN